MGLGGGEFSYLGICVEWGGRKLSLKEFRGGQTAYFCNLDKISIFWWSKYNFLLSYKCARTRSQDIVLPVPSENRNVNRWAIIRGFYAKIILVINSLRLSFGRFLNLFW